ncbi:MAG: hypothetical protein ACJAU0_001383 [Flavobacteriales bacterium]|jgi:hypothetical protein
MKNLLIALLVCFAASANAQMEGWAQTFKDTRVINGHSVETSQKGAMKFVISHRFGTLNGGTYELFGLDQSTIRMGLDYGLTDRLTLGAGRSSFEKTYDGFMKYRLLIQKDDKSPISITALANMAIKTLKWENPDRKNFATSRYFYTWQLLLARKFTDDLSIQLMPTVVHRNLVPNENIAHDVISIGGAIRYQLTKKMAVQVEGYYIPDDQLDADFTMPLSVGIDIETKGHQFQFSLSNSMGMTEKIFITETRNKWTDAGVGLGFNITRDFRIRGRK